MQQPMIIIGKHSITLRPELPERMLGYIKYYLKAIQAKRDAYLRKQPQPSQEDQTLTEAQRKIEEAEALVSGLEQLKDRIVQMHEMEFVIIADAYVAALKDLGYRRIEEVYTIDISVKHTAAALKTRNPYFSEQTFRNYINNGGKTI
jgi:hypothetical protein